MSVYYGRCHCDAIGYEYHSALEPRDWPVRACQCGFCRRHDVRSTSNPEAAIRFVATDPAKLHRYRFGLMTADFLLCGECGVYVGAAIETDAGAFGIVTLRALVERPADLQRAVPVAYDGEDHAGRMSRREKRWARVTSVPW